MLTWRIGEDCLTTTTPDGTFLTIEPGYDGYVALVLSDWEGTEVTEFESVIAAKEAAEELA